MIYTNMVAKLAQFFEISQYYFDYLAYFSVIIKLKNLKSKKVHGKFA